MVLCRKFRPERLQFHQHCSETAVAAMPTTCAQEALIASTLPGGFANFSASYPQYCESKSAAANNYQSGQCQPMVEPSYTQHGPTQLLSFLFVGSQTDALDADVIRRHGITHVLNVSSSCPQSLHVPAANFHRIAVNDGYVDKLLPHFQRAFQFLESVRLSSGRCLVHCLAGVSRSPTLSIAYIMKHKRMSQEEAYRYVKSRRPSISPNFNFLGQLLEFERQLKRGDYDGPTDHVDGVADADADADDCPETKRQRFVLRSPLATAAGQSPTLALSRLSFAQQQQAASASVGQLRVVDGRRPRPRSVALTTAAAAAAAAACPALWASSVAAAAAAAAAAVTVTATTATTRRSQSSESFMEYAAASEHHHLLAGAVVAPPPPSTTTTSAVAAAASSSPPLGGSQIVTCS